MMAPCVSSTSFTSSLLVERHCLEILGIQLKVSELWASLILFFSIETNQLLCQFCTLVMVLFIFKMVQLSSAINFDANRLFVIFICLVLFIEGTFVCQEDSVIERRIVVIFHAS